MNPAPAINIWREGVHAPCPDNSIEKSIVTIVRGNIVYLSGGKRLKKDYTFYRLQQGFVLLTNWEKNKNKNKSSSFQGKTIFYVVIQK